MRLAALLAALLPTLASAELVTLRLLPGWRDQDRHIAGLAIDLAPGWKTYWRAPGDAGIPPRITLSSPAQVLFPAPQVMDVLGARVVGYDGSVVLPVVLPVGQGAQDITLTADLGICHDICVPVSQTLTARLPDTPARDPALVAALAMVPKPHAGLTCAMVPTQGGMTLTVTAPIQLDHAETVIEVSDPMAWVAEPRTAGQSATAEVYGEALALDRAGVRLTVLSPDGATEYLGCD